LTEAAREAFDRHPDWPETEALVSAASKVIDRVLRQSELRELWEETDDFHKWRSEMDALKARLG
jgi:hypothetical protein